MYATVAFVRKQDPLLPDLTACCRACGLPRASALCAGHSRICNPARRVVPPADGCVCDGRDAWMPSCRELSLASSHVHFDPPRACLAHLRGTAACYIGMIRISDSDTAVQLHCCPALLHYRRRNCLLDRYSCRLQAGDRRYHTPCIARFSKLDNSTAQRAKVPKRAVLERSPKRFPGTEHVL